MPCVSSRGFSQFGRPGRGSGVNPPAAAGPSTSIKLHRALAAPRSVAVDQVSWSRRRRGSQLPLQLGIVAALVVGNARPP